MQGFSFARCAAIFASVALCSTLTLMSLNSSIAAETPGAEPEGQPAPKENKPDKGQQVASASERASLAYQNLVAARKLADASPKPEDSPAMAAAREKFEKAKTQEEREAIIQEFRKAMDEPEYANKLRAYREAWSQVESANRAFTMAFSVVSEWPEASDADMLIEGYVSTSIERGAAGNTSREVLDRIRKLKATSAKAIAARDLAMSVLLRQLLAGSTSDSLDKDTSAMLSEFSAEGSAHFSAIVGTFYLERGKWQLAGETFRSGLAALKEISEGHPLWEIRGDLETKAFVGMKAPEITAQYALGSDHTRLTAFQGKLVVLDFWATWCPPCLAGLPGLDEMASKYADQGVVVVGVTREYEKRGYLPTSMDELRGNAPKNGTQYQGDTPEAFRQHLTAFRENTKVGFPFLVADAEAMRTYKLVGIPTTFVVNREGVIVYATIGEAGTQISAAIERELAAEAAAKVKSESPPPKNAQEKAPSDDAKEEAKPSK